MMPGALPTLLLRPLTLLVVAACLVVAAFPSRPALPPATRALLSATLFAVVLGKAVQELLSTSIAWQLPRCRARLLRETLLVGFTAAVVLGLAAVVAAGRPATAGELVRPVAVALLALCVGAVASAWLRWQTVFLVAAAFVAVLPQLAANVSVAGPTALWALAGLAALAGMAWCLSRDRLARHLNAAPRSPSAWQSSALVVERERFAARSASGSRSFAPLDGSLLPLLRAFWQETFGASRFGWGRTALVVVTLVVFSLFITHLPQELETASGRLTLDAWVATVGRAIATPGGRGLALFLALAVLVAELCRRHLPGTERFLPLARRRLALVNGGLALAHLAAVGLLLAGLLIGLATLGRVLTGEGGDTPAGGSYLVVLLHVLALLPVAQGFNFALQASAARPRGVLHHPAVQILATATFCLMAVGLVAVSQSALVAVLLLAVTESLWWFALVRHFGTRDLV